MNSFLKLFLDNDFDNSATFDLSTKEGLAKFDKHLDSLTKSDKALLKLFGSFFDIDEDEDVVEGFRNLAHRLHDKANEGTKEVIDHTEDEDEFERPSEKLTVDQQMKLHKITQEYIDTMIKPYSKGILTNEQINDAYAGLYEFAAWILNR